MMPALRARGAPITVGLLFVCLACTSTLEAQPGLQAQTSDSETPSAKILLDHWDESFRLFGVSSGDSGVSDGIAERRQSKYQPEFIRNHPSDKRVGDFSLVYTPTRANNPSRFGFASSLWGETWTLNQDMRLQLSAKLLRGSRPMVSGKLC